MYIISSEILFPAKIKQSIFLYITHLLIWYLSVVQPTKYKSHTHKTNHIKSNNLHQQQPSRTFPEASSAWEAFCGARVCNHNLICIGKLPTTLQLSFSRQCIEGLGSGETNSHKQQICIHIFSPGWVVLWCWPF